MSIKEKLKSLAPRERALVAVAVLLDGHEAENYLRFDKQSGDLLREGATILSAFTPELRMPMAGTILREAIEEMSR